MKPSETNLRSSDSITVNRVELVELLWLLVRMACWVMQAVQFLASCMACSRGIDVSVAREILSICSHLARSSDEHLPLLTHIFEGPQSECITDNLPLQIILLNCHYIICISV